MIFNLTLILVAISLIDLFVNRLLFRAGPDVIAQLKFDATGLAIIGRISLTVEQLILFVVIVSTAALMSRAQLRAHRVLSAGLFLTALCSGLLYSPLPGQLAWSVSVLLIVAAGGVILGLVYLRISTLGLEAGLVRHVLQGFLVLIVVSFFFPLYYRVYSLSGPFGTGLLPLGFQSYEAGIFAVMITSVATLAYAIGVPSPDFKLGLRSFAKAAALPTLVVVPILYGLLTSFFATQIFSLVIVTTTDFALSHDLVQALVVVWWFLLTGVLILFLKGRHSSNKLLIQEAIGLLLIMSTTFLFNYPYYLMLGVVGVLFLCHPLGTVDMRQNIQLP